MQRVSAVIPAYNESARIGHVLRAVRDAPSVAEMVVVDDGSTDGTAGTVQMVPARLIQFPTNRGKAAALDAGIRAAQFDTILMLDADLPTLRPDHLESLIEAYQTHDLDMAIGIRDFDQQPLTYRVLPSMLGSVSGERVFARDLWRRFAESVDGLTQLGYAVDMLLTRFALRGDGRVGQVYLPGLEHTAHHAKRSAADAVKGYAKIWTGIATGMIRPIKAG